jgi:hypothetical protein
MWPALVGVVVRYGFVVVVDVSVSAPPDPWVVDGVVGPVTTGLSWLVWTLGIL